VTRLNLPLPAALGIGAITALTLFVLVSPDSGPARNQPQQIAARDLLFLDASDGAVDVVSAGAHQEVARFKGEQGFLRGTLRGFARSRHLDGLGPEIPFHLARWSDGRLTLDDPATGEHVELLAFGQTNAAVFATLLETTR